MCTPVNDAGASLACFKILQQTFKTYRSDHSKYFFDEDFSIKCT
jgi:hypothetical protein